MIKKNKPKIFVNLPVKDLERSMAFFSELGYRFNPQFTDENAACMVISDDIFVMLLTEKIFVNFTNKSITDAAKNSEVIVSISRDTREKVDDLVNRALQIGGKPSIEAAEHGFMYIWGFQDPDNHIWEVVYMDPDYVEEMV